MFAVGFAGITAVVATIWIGRQDQASNGRDVRNAIAKMAAIATAMHDEKPLLKQQADALTDTAAASQVTASASSHQSADFKRQTAAIVKQADALIRSAQATVTAAGAQLAAAQANTKTAEAGRLAAEEQRRSAELIAAGQAPSARLASVPIEGLDSTPDKEGTISVKIKPTYINNGGGGLNPILVTFSLVIGESIPDVPPKKYEHAFGGNDFHVAPSGIFHSVVGYTYKFSKDDIADVRSHKKSIFVWGVISFADVRGTRYQICYGAVVRLPSEDSPEGAVIRAGPETYHCGGG